MNFVEFTNYSHFPNFIVSEAPWPSSLHFYFLRFCSLVFSLRLFSLCFSSSVSFSRLQNGVWRFRPDPPKYTWSLEQIKFHFHKASSKENRYPFLWFPFCCFRAPTQNYIYWIIFYFRCDSRMKSGPSVRFEICRMALYKFSIKNQLQNGLQICKMDLDTFYNFLNENQSKYGLQISGWIDIKADSFLIENQIN